MRKSLLLLVALLLAPACSAFGAAPAATVLGTEITVDDVESELEVIAGNDEYRDRLEQSYGFPVEGSAGKGTFDAAMAANILTFRIYFTLVERDLEKRGELPLSDDALQSAESSVRQRFATISEEAFDSFPADYREKIIRDEALVQSLLDGLSNDIGNDPRAFYDEHPEQFAEICVSHILVSAQQSSPEDADASARGLYERVRDGADFATLAEAESDDPSAAENGGSLGCGSRYTLPFDAAFERAAFALEEGEVSEPVQTQFGSHIILVTERRVPRYADVADVAPAILEQSGQEITNEYVAELLCGSDVKVNPRYGTWTVDRCEAPVPELPRVEPPEGPVGKTPALELDL